MSIRTQLVRVLVLVAIAATLALGAAQQDNPIAIRLEIYIVSEVTQSDGSVEERFSEATTARPGQVIEYRLFATNTGDTTLPAGTVVILGPVPDGTTYIENSTTPTSERLITEFTADGETYSEPPLIVGEGDDRRLIEPSEYETVRWTLLVPMEPEQEEVFFYRVLVE